MAISAGTRLGPYEVIAPLGAGGMGEVFKAHDTRLDRHVAIKVLTTAAAGDSEFRARCQAEVEHLHGAVRADLDIGRLEVAMRDAEFVRGLERVGDLPGDR